jgi:hypothetical protein
MVIVLGGIQQCQTIRGSNVGHHRPDACGKAIQILELIFGKKL